MKESSLRACIMAVNRSHDMDHASSCGYLPKTNVKVDGVQGNGSCL